MFAEFTATPNDVNAFNWFPLIAYGNVLKAPRIVKKKKKNKFTAMIVAGFRTMIDNLQLTHESSRYSTNIYVGLVQNQ